ncbi:MAG: hypothetical protein F6J93_38235 [Oscillatoria sp. SIO1A7]|nr:hypothetical protein [Oscillatoria sp. SIO1A7]
MPFAPTEIPKAENVTLAYLFPYTLHPTPYTLIFSPIPHSKFLHKIHLGRYPNLPSE